MEGAFIYRFLFGLKAYKGEHKRTVILGRERVFTVDTIGYMAPTLVPFTLTFTPGNGWFLSSTTVPLMVMGTWAAFATPASFLFTMMFLLSIT
jgi:hypothetical protein